MTKRKKERARDDDDEVRAPAAPAIGTGLGALLKGVTIGPAKKGAKPDAKAPAKSMTKAPAKAAAVATSSKTATAKAPASKSAKGAATEAPSAADRPSTTLKGHDRTAFYDAYAGVRPLENKKTERRVASAEAPSPPRVVIQRGPDPNDEARRKLGALVAGAFVFDVAIDRDGDVEGLRRDVLPAVLDALRRHQPRIDATLDLHGESFAQARDRTARWVRDQHARRAHLLLVIHGKGLHSEPGAETLRTAVIEALTESGATPHVQAFASAPLALGGVGALVVQLTR